MLLYPKTLIGRYHRYFLKIVRDTFNIGYKSEYNYYMANAVRTEKGKNNCDKNDNQGSLYGICDI